MLAWPRRRLRRETAGWKWLSGLAALAASDGFRVGVADAENSPIMGQKPEAADGRTGPEVDGAAAAGIPRLAKAVHSGRANWQTKGSCNG
jgi:hypothetical protein